MQTVAWGHEFYLGVGENNERGKVVSLHRKYTNKLKITGNMKKFFTTLLVFFVALTGFAQGWPANYDGVMLQGFYWDSYTDTKWTNLESQADELSKYFDLIWVPNSAYPGTTSNNMGYHPMYWFDHRSAFGTENELKSMIAAFNAKGVGVIEDVVINHRVGVTNWCDFPSETYKGVTYKLGMSDICKNDECKDNGYTPTGASDTGENWAYARDLDHTNTNVQNNVNAYLAKLKELGYVGFRYDYVKGFGATYVGKYNKTANPTFSVGECWDGNKTVVTSWINGTKVDGVIQSAAFDFPLKYYINDAFNEGKWSRLNGGCLADDNTYKCYAVTFVDNHDTGRFGEAPLYDNIEAANAYILTMPGTPCVWLSHLKSYPATIKKLITIRKAAGIRGQSAILKNTASTSGYVLSTEGTKGNLLLLLGSATASTDGYQLALEGKNFKLYASSSVDLSALAGITEKDPDFTVPTFCKKNDNEVCAFVELSFSPDDKIRCWAWNDKCNFTAGSWPGSECTYVGTNSNTGNKVYKWTWNGKAYKPNTTTEMTPDGTPAMIIFNNVVKNSKGDWEGKQTANLTFVDGGYYVEQGTLRATVSSSTGIESITFKPSLKGDGKWYDLRGRQLNGEPTSKGVYIYQGKKILRK